MATKASQNLHTSKNNSNDEYYSRYEDIENELKHYTEQLKDKVIFCNCDNPEFSNFWKYFRDNFHQLELKGLISCFHANEPYSLEYDGATETKNILISGDFRGSESIDLLNRADIVITNPPFSLFTPFADLLIKYDKDFLVIFNPITVKVTSFREKLKANLIQCGIHRNMKYTIPDGSLVTVNSAWVTTLKTPLKPLTVLTKEFEAEHYPKFTNVGYDYINVDRVKDIPKDYHLPMGVPITFLSKYNIEQFKLIDILCNGVVKGKTKFMRAIIQRRIK